MLYKTNLPIISAKLSFTLWEQHVCRAGKLRTCKRREEAHARSKVIQMKTPKLDIHHNIERLKDWTIESTHCWRKHNTNFDLPQIAFYLLPKCTVDFTAHPISQFFLPNWASGCEGFMCVEQEIWGFYWSRRREKAGAQCKIIQI